MKTDVILYFGSFNPVHNGHMAIARYVLDQGLCREVWFVVSPHNPLKEEAGLIDERQRLEMVEIAIAEAGNPDKMKACDVEFSMPRPSYTVDTADALQKLYPHTRFGILIGSDNVASLDKWKDYRRLLDTYPFFVYPREGCEPTRFKDKFTLLRKAPLWNYSSTDIRRAIGAGGEIGEMVSREVCKYIQNNKLWQ